MHFVHETLPRLNTPPKGGMASKIPRRLWPCCSVTKVSERLCDGPQVNACPGGYPIR